MKLFEDLQWRGLIKQVTSPKVEELLNSSEPITFYCGFDATADSLHIGSLLPLITMRRLQEKGHSPIVLLGGWTTFLGDPSFKSQERKLLEENEIKSNTKGIEKSIKNVIRCELVNNFDWFSKMNLMTFLRDIGKNFTVNHMMAKESVRARLEDRDQGISFTEFSYMLFQAYDFVHLAKEKNCILQVSGSDQWGNLTAGINLAHKLLNKDLLGLTTPLITKSDGTKFGKSEKGNIWLDPDKTSPFEFYQFLIRSDDKDVIQLLKFLTFLSKEDIEKLEESLKLEPHFRKAQLALAQTLTRMIHGEEALKEAEEKTNSLFNQSGNLVADLSMDRSKIVGVRLTDLLVELKLSSSKTMAKKEMESGAVYLNDQKITDQLMVVLESHIKNQVIVVKKGKKNIKVIRVS